MNAKDSDVEAMRKEFVERKEFEKLKELILQLMPESRGYGNTDFICPTCGCVSKRPLYTTPMCKGDE